MLQTARCQTATSASASQPAPLGISNILPSERPVVPCAPYQFCPRVLARMPPLTTNHGRQPDVQYAGIYSARHQRAPA